MKYIFNFIIFLGVFLITQGCTSMYYAEDAINLFSKHKSTLNEIANTVQTQKKQLLKSPCAEEGFIEFFSSKKNGCLNDTIGLYRIENDIKKMTISKYYDSIEFELEHHNIDGVFIDRYIVFSQNKLKHPYSDAMVLQLDTNWWYIEFVTD